MSTGRVKIEALRSKLNKTLKACPFCGHGATIQDGNYTRCYQYFFVGCNDCCASTYEDSDMLIAVADWNRRATT